MCSRENGGCNFAAMSASDIDPRRALWIPAALPTVIPLTGLQPELRSLVAPLDLGRLGDPLLANGQVQLFEARPGLLRLERLDPTVGIRPAAVLLPLDGLFEIRAAAAMRLARALTGRRLDADPSALPASRRARLLLALRALDIRGAPYVWREVACTVRTRFSNATPATAWADGDRCRQA